MKDQKTISYFDDTTPEYSCERFNFAIETINRLASHESSLLDIGCGTGNILSYIKKKTNLVNIAGLDVSSKCLYQLQKKIKCKTYNCSILDKDIYNIVPELFDFVVIGVVLHHIVGKTRKESRHMASMAIRNALNLLKEGGYLIIFEICFYPTLTMDLAFYIKKILSSITSNRVEIFSRFPNIGTPVVSFFTTEHLEEIIIKNKEIKIVERYSRAEPLSLIYRLSGISKKEHVTLVIKKTATGL